MPAVLGRVTSDLTAVRGPDCIHKITVPAEWLTESATVEVELPRNLICAVCEGGGCDRCERSGAITLRGRKDPPELVEVTLPPDSGVQEPSSRPAGALVVRIPERGGLAAEEGLPRGVLLLQVRVGEPSGGVTRLEEPAPLARESEPGRLAEPQAPLSPSRSPRQLLLVAVLVLAVVLIAIVLAQLR